MIMIKKSGADKRKGKLNNAGFSLVEVLVAMAVLAILSIPVLGSFSNAARINHKARKEENANTVASDIVEQFKSVSMSRILEDYAGKYTESSGKYIFRETKEGTNGEEYTVVTELDPGIYNSGDDSDKNYNNNINSYVNSVKNIVLREDLYSHDIDAENYFKERYTAGFDKNKIEKTTNVKIEVKHSELSEAPAEASSAVDTGIDAYYQRITLDFEYIYDGNKAYAYTASITYPNNYFKAEITGDNSYRISSSLPNNLKDVYMFYIPYDRHSTLTVGDNRYYYTTDKINITYDYQENAFVKYDNCNVFLIQQTSNNTTDSSKNMMINKDKVSLYLNKDTSRQEFANVGTINLGNKTVNKDGTTNPGPVSVFSNIYKWDEYKDINNTGSGSNGVASKSLLYTMSVKVYYGSNADTSKEEPMIQMTTTKIG